MTITLVGGFTGASGGSGTATTGTRTTTTGNFLVSAGSTQNAAATTWRTTVATTQNLTVIGRRTASGDSIDTAYLANITGKTNDAILYTPASGAFVSVSAAEFAGVKTTSPLDVENHASGGTTGAYTAGATISCPTLTTTQAGDLVIGVVTVEAGSTGTFSGVGSWAIASQYGDANVSSTSVIIYQIVGGAGSYTPQCTYSVNGTAVGTAASAFFDANPPAGFVRPTIVVPTGAVTHAASW